MTVLYAIYAFVIGACLASFAGVVGERVPRGESINGRSHCACGRQLRAIENIPVVGWVASGGTARCCGSTIPVRYVIGELALGTLGALGVVVGGLVGGAVALGVGFAAVVAASWRRPDAP